MERNVKFEELSRGSYGVVLRAFNKRFCEYLVIMQPTEKHESWDECINLIEVKSLMNNNHPNIDKLKAVVKENCSLYLAFQNMECNVYSILQRKILSDSMI